MDSFDLLQEEVAKRVGKNRSTVTNALRLLRLPDGIKTELAEGRLSMGHARALLALEQEEDILEAGREVIRKKLSVRDTEKLIKKIKNFEKVKPKKINEPIDPNQMALIDSLQQQLGTQVRLMPKGKGGKLEISYHDQDGLNRLLDLFGIEL